MKRVAFLLKGGVSRISGSTAKTNGIYDQSPYVNFKATKLSIDKHIIKFNPTYQFDFFLHSWNKDLSEELLNLYNPKKYLFEDNTLYTDTINQKLQLANSNNFRQVSQFLSLYKGCELIEEYANDSNSVYDLIIVYRFDLLLWKDMILDQYNPNNLCVNCYVNRDGEDGLGDFHIVTGFDHMHTLKSIYDSIGPSNPPIDHNIIKTYMRDIARLNLQIDNIVAGHDQEVTRKLGEAYQCGRISQSILEDYNLSVEEVLNYKAS